MDGIDRKPGYLHRMHDRQFAILWLVIFTALLFAAWSLRYIQDDAYISIRYAANLVHGHGLVFNPGERVEGYSNFLWTMLIAGALSLGLEPVKFTYAIGLALFALSLVCTYRLGTLVFRSRNKGLLTMALLGCNYSFCIYATGGMETQLQTSLFIASAFLVARALLARYWKLQSLFFVSSLLGLALLTRMDSLLLAIVLVPAAIMVIFREPPCARIRIFKTVALLGPCTIMAGLWLWWKMSYYGDILPNTFHLKVMSGVSVLRGLYYVYIFFSDYWLIPSVFCWLFFLYKFIRPSYAALWPLSTVILIWLAYIVKVGGDFMEFRFIVPILPFIMINIVWVLSECVTQKAIRIVFASIVVAGSLNHGVTFKKLAYLLDIESRKESLGYVKKESEAWEEIGKTLGSAFEYSPRVKIAVCPAGAIPYYSRLTTIDMLGLTDPWISRFGDPHGTRPGHQRIASMRYLVEKKVNILISHPLMERDTLAGPKQYSLSDLRHFSAIKDLDSIPVEAKVLKIPINGKYRLVALYLAHNEIVERAIQKYSWQVFPIRAE